MPRSSKHKSSKHSSRDAREYSDSEKESSLRERKSKDENSTRALKESGSGDKRKLDSKGNKEYCDSFNGEYYEEYTSSKRRREKTEDGVNDRWNGGDEDRGESSKKSKISSEKSRKIEEVDGEETKRSTKTDGKHRESSRRENKEIEKEKGRDRDRDRDRKHKEGKHEKFYDGEDHNGLKVASGKTDLNALGSENYSGKRARRKRDDRGNDDEHQDTIDDAKDRLLSGDDNIQDVRQKEEKHRDKYQEGIEEEKHRGDKQKDDRLSKEQVRSDDKRFRDEKEASESKRKKSKVQENNHDHGQEHVHEPDNEHDGYRDRPRDYERSRDYDREYDRSRDRDRDRHRDKDREKERERVRDRRDNERDRFHERDWDRGRSRDRDWDHDRERTHDREKARSRDYYYDRERSKGERDRDFDRDVPHIDDQSGRDKDRRSPDDHDDLSDSKSRTVVGHADMDIRSSKAQLDGERIKSQSRSHGGQDDIGPISDQRSKGISSRDTVDLSGGSERSLKYRASEKTAKMEDGSIGELTAERSSSTKASPRGLVEKSPSLTSNERRYINQSGSRRSLEVEESGQRSYSRDLSAHEERSSRGLPPDKSFGDDTFQAELSFSNKAHQNNSSFQPRPESRGGIGSPLVGSLEEDNRVNIGGRYRRGVDLNMGRGQGNAWRGAPNWPSPVSNGFIPFPHGPPHGGFQSMMPQFPSPSLFGVRPSMEMNHSGIPYHMPDAERFSGHMRPLGWQNMMDGSGPSLMHGWDMNNGVFRDEPHMYGVAEWDHNRRMHSGGWESSADAWKAQNGDANMDVLSMSQKDNQSGQAAEDDILTAQTSHSENNRSKSVEAGSNVTSPAKDLPMNSPKVVVEETSDRPVAETMDNAEQCHRYYLSKLDISVELVDAELHSECMSLLMDEQCPIIDGGTTVVINLKDEGKSLPKDDYTTLSTFSLIPAANCSLFQTAIDLYKEQRVEMKGLSTTENEKPQVCPPEADEISGDVEMDDAKEEDCCIQVSGVPKSNVLDSKASQEKPEAPLHGDAETTEKHESKSYEALMEGLPQQVKADDGSAGIAETEETSEKSDRGDDVTATLGPETRESESVVISRIHHSPQSTR